MKAFASVAIFLFILFTNPAKASRLPAWCSTSSTQHEQCPVGSLCEDGRCSNPFVNGCLLRKMEATTTSSAGTLEDLREENIETSTRFKSRVCNSDDAGDISDTSSSCVKPTFPYKEVRIAPGNWDSSILVSVV